MEKKTEVGFNDYGGIVIVQETTGYVGAKYETKEVQLIARRVDPDGDDHIQAEIKITAFFSSGSTRRMHASLVLTPQVLHQLTEHLAQPWPGIKR